MAECPVCSCRRAEPSFVVDGFQHFHCRDCHALYVSPLPSASELSQYYVAREEATRSSQCWEREEHDYRHYEPIWDEALRQIEKSSGRGALLDVGCGGGQFLAFARRRGWDQLEGIEYAPGAAARARERSGASVHSVDFLASGLEPANYAGITMWNVIEHTPDPRAFVAEVHRLLRPAGVYVADCPNRYGVTMRAIGKNAYVVMPPEHLTYFCHRSLRRLLIGGGLEICKLGCNTIYINDWARLLTKPKGETQARQTHLRWYSRATGSGFALGLISLANLALNAARLGDQMLVVARRPAARP